MSGEGVCVHGAESVTVTESISLRINMGLLGRSLHVGSLGKSLVTGPLRLNGEEYPPCYMFRERMGMALHTASNCPSMGYCLGKYGEGTAETRRMAGFLLVSPSEITPPPGLSVQSPGRHGCLGMPWLALSFWGRLACLVSGFPLT